MPDLNYKSGCLVCGKELAYLKAPEKGFCSFCNKEFSINERCIDGHYICNSCHSLPAFDIIEEYCKQTPIANPISLADFLMKHPSVRMHGPEHHYLVPAILITAYCLAAGRKNEIPMLLSRARLRAESVPGGFCGTHGNCGAAVGTGIFMSMITGANSLSVKEWQLSNLITAKSLYSIAIHGGPRCCKRDTFIAISEAVTFVKEQLDIQIENTEDIKCSYSALNKECLKGSCLFYQI